MKRTFILIITLTAMLFPVFSNAQSVPVKTNTDADAAKGLDIANTMMKATLGLGDDFVKYKGDFLQKDASENSYYTVKELDMGASSQYVIVRKNGVSMFVSTFKGTDKEDKTPGIALTTFIGGIKTVSNNKDIVIIPDVSNNQSNDVIKYFLTVKDRKIASFTFNTVKNEGRMVVAFQ